MPTPPRRISLRLLATILLASLAATQLLLSSKLLRRPRSLRPAPPPAPPAPPPGPRLLLPGTLSDPDPLHIVSTLCGNPTEASRRAYHGLLTVKSILMARAAGAGVGARRHYHFHLITNVSPEELFNTTRLNWEVYRALRREAAAGTASFTVHPLAALDAAVAAATGDPAASAAVPNHLFANCASARLKLPFLLGGAVERVLYLDWDAVALCDLTALWDGAWPAFGREQLLGFAPADPSGARDPDSRGPPRHPTLGAINSGVMLMHVGRLHARGRALGLEFWRAAGAIVASRVNLTGDGERDYWALLEAFALGDQDVLNALFAPRSAAAPWGRPEWLFPLPFRFNHCLDPPFPEALARAGRAAASTGYAVGAPCVVHFCGQRIFTNDRGQAVLAEGGGDAWKPVEDPTQAAYTYVKYWPIEEPQEPPGMRG